MSELTPLKGQVYKDPRPPECFERYHHRARTREPDLVYDVVRALACLLCWTVFRARSLSSGNVPARGPVILAPNHASYADHFFVGCFLRRRVRFMGKSQIFQGVMGWIYSHGGVFPVRRGHGDEEAFITARTVLAKGGCIAMYPEGGRSPSGEQAERARPGVGRLALESGAPVVPVAIHGSSRVRNWKRLKFPRVTVRYGRPLRWDPVEAPTRHQQQVAADRILEEIRALMNEPLHPGAPVEGARGRG